MAQPIPSPSDDQIRCEKLRLSCHAMMRVLDLVLILLRAGRPVDLSGLDQWMGALCAQILDLPPDRGGSLLPDLAAQLTLLETIAGAMSAPP